MSLTVMETLTQKGNAKWTFTRKMFYKTIISKLDNELDRILNFYFSLTRHLNRFLKLRLIISQFDHQDEVQNQEFGFDTTRCSMKNHAAKNSTVDA